MKDNKNKKEQNLLVFTCCVSFHKYERIDLVALFLKSDPSTSLKLYTSDRGMMSNIHKREQFLNKALFV